MKCPNIFIKRSKKIDILPKILSIIYPQVCLICGRPVQKEICNKCELMLNRQLALGIDDYTLNNEKEFDEHMYLYAYDGIIRKLILQYKFQEKSYLYKIFVKNLKNNKKMYLFLKKYDIIIPVPISKKRIKQRGYNQSSLLALEISKVFNIEYNDNSLIKSKHTESQSSLNKEERIKNVENVYSVKNQEKILNKKILLLDDIYTTGSTVNECSKVLKQEGAKNIGILTIAKD